MFATDVTDPASPVPCPDPIDLGRNDGVTDYAHDVQVDAQGVAWVSGAGGIRGYWTSGAHRDPLTGNTETATGCKPIPYAGSGTPASGTPSRFMHNSFREPGPPAPTARAAAVAAPPAPLRDPAPVRHAQGRPSRARPLPRVAQADRSAPPPPTRQRSMRERVLYGTEENLTSDCATSGRFVTYDLEGTFGAEGFKDTDKTMHRMKVLDTWTPEKAEGADACASAHYFTSRGDGIFANAFYGQGVRFLDVSDPTNIRQVGWYRPSGANTWAAYWHKGLVYFTDDVLGVHILRLEAGTRSRTVRAPALRSRHPKPRFDRRVFGGLCPLPD